MMRIGTDMVEIFRIRNLVKKYGTKFLEKVYTEEEQKQAKLRSDPIPYFAGRWAVKEAVSKALGCGIGEKCGWKDISVLNDKLGKPVVILSGNAKTTADNLQVINAQVSITHTQEYALAFVMLETRTD